MHKPFKLNSGERPLPHLLLQSSSCVFHFQQNLMTLTQNQPFLNRMNQRSQIYQQISDSDAGFCCCMISRAMVFKYSRKLSVIPPMEVTKLMENHVFLGYPWENRFKQVLHRISESRSLSLQIPRSSNSSYTITKQQVQNQQNSFFQKIK